MSLQAECVHCWIHCVLSDPDISKRDVRAGMVEYLLQQSHVFEFFIVPITERFSHGVGADPIKSDVFRRLFQYVVCRASADWFVKPFTALKQKFLVILVFNVISQGLF